MILTEVEAGKRWCPMAKGQEGLNRCIGSNCMMWAWAVETHEFLYLQPDDPIPEGGWLWTGIRNRFITDHERRPGQGGYVCRKVPHSLRTGECGLIRQAVVEPG